MSGTCTRCLIILFLVTLIHLLPGGICNAFDNKQSSVKLSLVLNCLDRHGVDGAMWFLNSIKLFSSFPLSNNTYLFYNYDDISQKDLSSPIFHYFQTNFLSYDKISMKGRLFDRKYNESSNILKMVASWNYILSVSALSRDESGSEEFVLSVTFRSGSFPVATSSFDKLIEVIENNLDIDMLLLGKTKKFTTISDWHDLMLMGFKRTNPFVRKWIDDFYQLYYEYSTTSQFFLFTDPRPAILEASSKFQLQLKVGHFTPEDVCSVAIPFDSYFDDKTKDLIQQYSKHLLSGNISQYFERKELLYQSNHHYHYHEHHHLHHHNDTSKCSYLYTSQYTINHKTISKQSQLTSVTPAIEVYCGLSAEPSSYQTEQVLNCLTLEVSRHWKKLLDKSIPKTFKSFSGLDLKDIKNGIKTLADSGIARFIDKTLGKNLTTESNPNPFCWDLKGNFQPLKYSAHIVSSKGVGAGFNHSIRNDLEKGKGTSVIATGLKGAATVLDRYKYFSISKQYYAKMNQYESVTLTMEEFLGYFPEHLRKLLIGKSYDNQYNIVKPLMILSLMYQYLHKNWIVWTDYDVFLNPGWLYLPIEAFVKDVPSTAVLILSNSPVLGSSEVMLIRNTPKGRKVIINWMVLLMRDMMIANDQSQAALTTLLSSRLYNQTVQQVLNNLGHSNDKKYKDNNYEHRIHQSIVNDGYKTDEIATDNTIISSVAKGCANSALEDCFILTESSILPRLLCRSCASLNEISCPGRVDRNNNQGNIALMMDFLNSWFMNSHADYLFYDAYLDKSACTSIDDVVPPCELHNLHDHLSHDEHEQTMMKEERHIVSLTDGLAYDADKGTYCKQTNPAMLSQQKSTTYMKDYATTSQIMTAYTSLYDDWIKSRSSECKNVKPRIERSQYCQSCSSQSLRNKNKDGVMNSLSIIDCRDKKSRK